MDASKKKIITPICNRIRYLRKKKNMSLDTLAELAELSSLHMGRIERKEKIPRLDSVIKIAHGLGIHPKELFSSTYDPKDKIKNEIDNTLVAKSQRTLKRILNIIKALEE